MSLRDFFRKPKKAMSEETALKYHLYNESQKNFTEAATITIDIARDVTHAINKRMDDYIHQIAVTSSVVADALVVSDPNGLIESFNPAAEIIFGYTTEEMTGEPITKLFVNTWGEEISMAGLFETFKEEEQNGISPDGEVVDTINGLKKDGSMFYVDINVSKLTRHNGPAMTIFTVRDVSKHIAIQQELAERELHYRTMFEMSFDGIAIIRDFNILEKNPAWNTLFCCEEDSICTSKHCDVREFIRDDYRQKFTVCHERHMAGEDTTFELELACKDGKGNNLEVVMTCALVDTCGGTPASLVTVRDVTSKNEIENKLRESDQLYRNIFNNDYEGLILVQDFSIVDINPVASAMLGLRQEHLYGASFSRFVAPEAMGMILDFHGRRMGGWQETITYSLPIKRRDGETIVYTATSSYVQCDSKPASLITIHKSPLVKD